MHIIERPDDPALQAFAAYDGKVIELFAGPGGMSEGIKLAGIPARSVLGIEYDRAACETATAAGHPRYLADIAALDPSSFGHAWGLHASPPCPGFSAAGKGEGRKDLSMLALALKRLAASESSDDVMAEVIATQHDPRSALSLEPMVWLMALRPEWITLEQVPAVLPLWREYAAALHQLGYHVWTGAVSAETVGVPQTRKRAVLLGSKAVDVSGGIRATHSRYHSRMPERFDPGVQKWVSMAEALGWGMTQRPYPTVTVGSAAGGTDPQCVGGSGARGAIRREYDSGHWVNKPGFMGDVYNSHGCIRSLDEPAPTLTASMDNGNFRWTTSDDPRITERIAKKGHRPAGQAATIGARVEPQEAGILQSFPADYPLRGAYTEQYQQVGNAVPPLLGQAMIETVLGRR